MTKRCGVLLVCWASLVLAQSSPPASPAPFYAVSSIVNAAHPSAPLSPNSIATIYGTGLAQSTAGVSFSDLSGVTLPTAIPGTYVRVSVGGIYARPIYVSPGQINFIVPSGLRGGIDTFLRVEVWGRYGPEVRLRLEWSAPALFQADPQFTVAARPDGSVITHENPAAPGDVVILYATGLGAVHPAVPEGQLATRAAYLERFEDFRVEIDGIPVSRESVLYAGAAPGFAGLYQINFVLPALTPHNPAVRIGFSDRVSPEGVRLPVR